MNENDSIIKALYAFFATCPLMDDRMLYVDYLPESAKPNGIEYSIDATPGVQVIPPVYIDGGANCQYTFLVRSVNNYGPDYLQSIANSGFFDRLTEWMRIQTRNSNLPQLPSNMIPRAIEAMSVAYLYGEGAQSGKYQIQCRLLYYRKGDR